MKTLLLSATTKDATFMTIQRSRLGTVTVSIETKPLAYVTSYMEALKRKALTTH